MEHAKETDDKPGFFGVSILGARTKFPAVVCEVDPQGPANLTEKVSVGSRCLKVVWEGRKEGWWERRRRKRKVRRRWKGRRGEEGGINLCEFWRGGIPGHPPSI